MPRKEERRKRIEQKEREIRLAEQEESEISEEDKKVDIKGTFEMFIEGEKPEVSQEEEIKLYKPEDEKNNPINKKKSTSEEDDEDDALDEEHIARVKQELLASLDRVNKLAKILFAGKDKDIKNNIKTKEKSKAKAKNRKNEEKPKEEKNSEGFEKTRE